MNSDQFERELQKRRGAQRFVYRLFSAFETLLWILIAGTVLAAIVYAFASLVKAAAAGVVLIALVIALVALLAFAVWLLQ